VTAGQARRALARTPLPQLSSAGFTIFWGSAYQNFGKRRCCGRRPTTICQWLSVTVRESGAARPEPGSPLYRPQTPYLNRRTTTGACPVLFQWSFLALPGPSRWASQVDAPTLSRSAVAKPAKGFDPPRRAVRCAAELRTVAHSLYSRVLPQPRTTTAPSASHLRPAAAATLGSPKTAPRCPATAPGTPAAIAGHPASVLGTLAMIPGTRATIPGRHKTILGTLNFTAGHPEIVLGTPKMDLGRLRALLGAPAMLARPPAAVLWLPTALLGAPAMVLRVPKTILGLPVAASGAPAAIPGRPAMVLGVPKTIAGAGPPARRRPGAAAVTRCRKRTCVSATGHDRPYLFPPPPSEQPQPHAPRHHRSVQTPTH